MCLCAGVCLWGGGVTVGIKNDGQSCEKCRKEEVSEGRGKGNGWVKGEWILES